MGSHSTLTADSRDVLEGTENLGRVPPQEDAEEEEEPCAPPPLEDGMTDSAEKEDLVVAEDGTVCGITKASVATPMVAATARTIIADFILGRT